MVVPAESLAGVAAELTAEGALVVMVMLAPLLAAQVVKLVEQLVTFQQREKQELYKKNNQQLFQLLCKMMTLQVRLRVGPKRGRSGLGVRAR